LTLFISSLSICKVGSFLSELRISDVIIIIFSLYFQFSFFFRLLYSLFCINCWESKILCSVVESKEWDCPVTFFIVPFWSLMQFLQFIFT
jgi:hypothetical protein